MRSRLQLACCQLLFLSTIACSAQTPPTTTDVTINENQSMDESVEPRAINQYAVAEANHATTLDAISRAHQATQDEVWKHALADTSFQSFYQATKVANQVLPRDAAWMEHSLEDWMTTYQLPTWEANHYHIVMGTLNEVSKYPMEGSSDPNQSLEASVQHGTTMYQPPTAEANHHHTIDATWTLEDATTETTRPLTTWAVDEAWKDTLEGSSFQTASSNNVPLEYQDTVEANQATKEALQVLTREMEQVEDSLEDWMMTYQLPTLEANHHHTIMGTLDEVLKYPMEGSSDPNQSLEASVQDGTTMYQPPTAEANHHHTIDATFTLEDAWRYAMEDISDANQSVEASMEDGTTLFQHATTETTPPWAVDEVFNYGMEVGSFQTAASNNVPLEYQETVEANQAQTLPTWLDQEQATVDVDAPSMMALNALAMNTRIVLPASGNVVEESMETRMYEPATGEANRIDASAVPLSPCVAHTSQGLPPWSYPMSAVSSVPCIPTHQISKSGKPYSKHPRAIWKRKARALETPQKRAERLQYDRNWRRAKTAELRAVETPQKRAERLQADRNRKRAKRARVQEPNQIEGESSQKKSKS